MDTIYIFFISATSLIIWGVILRSIFSVGTLVKHSKAQTDFLFLLAVEKDKNQADNVLIRHGLKARKQEKNEQGYVVDKR